MEASGLHSTGVDLCLGRSYKEQSRSFQLVQRMSVHALGLTSKVLWPPSKTLASVEGSASYPGGCGNDRREQSAWGVDQGTIWGSK